MYVCPGGSVPTCRSSEWRDAIGKTGIVRKAELEEKNMRTQRTRKGLLEALTGAESET